MHIDKKCLFLAVFFVCCVCIFPQTSSSQKLLRIKVWAPIEQNPSIQSPKNQNDNTELAPLLIKQLSPFLLSGMIYGWTFEYTPKDNARGVEEYFELTPVSSILENDKNIAYTDAAYLDSRLYCWVQYPRTAEMLNYKKIFDSVKAEKIHGTGNSTEIEYTKGIQEALTNSAKDAVNSYAKKLVKNKPKTITGKLLLKEQDPSIKILNGKYSCDLDFFLYVDKIIQYSY